MTAALNEKWDKRRLVRRIYAMNDWTLDDDQVDGLIEHLRRRRKSHSDLKRAIESYVDDGGVHRPRFGDLIDHFPAVVRRQSEYQDPDPWRRLRELGCPDAPPPPE